MEEKAAKTLERTKTERVIKNINTCTMVIRGKPSEEMILSKSR
jgi:hypothetical protein